MLVTACVRGRANYGLFARKIKHGSFSHLFWRPASEQFGKLTCDFGNGMEMPRNVAFSMNGDEEGAEGEELRAWP
jgi:hypothetical protein